MEEALLKANDDLDACTFELEKEAEEADESNRAQETTFNREVVHYKIGILDSVMVEGSCTFLLCDNEYGNTISRMNCNW